jgi:hypothetical protein
MEAGNHGPIRILSWHLPGVNEENYEKPQSGYLEFLP